MANERRLISADALEARLGGLCDEFGVDHLFIDVIVDEIGNAPTVDAVEVVRCKDCKHMEITMSTLCWCNKWERICNMDEKGYCNYGEKREVE